MNNPMDEITPQIYIGNSQSPFHLIALQEQGINVVFNVAADLDYTPTKGDYFKASLIDGGGNDPKAFFAAVGILHTLVDLYGKVLIHCHEGKSRSASVVAAYLALKNGWTVDDTLIYIKSKRPVVKPDYHLVDLAKAYRG